MKKIISLVLIAMLMMQLTIAQIMTIKDSFPNQAIKPGDGLYGLDRAIERVQLAFAFRPETKANLRLQLAEERLAELSQLEPEEADRYTAQLRDEYETELEEAEQEGENIEDIQERRRFQERARERTQHHVEVLEAVRERIMNDDNPNNDNALNGLNRALENAQRFREKTRVRLGETTIEEIEEEYGSDFADSIRQRIENENANRGNGK